MRQKKLTYLPDPNNNNNNNNKKLLVFFFLTNCYELVHPWVKKWSPEIRGGKVSPNPFARPNPLTLIEPKPSQLLVGLNEYQPN